MIDVVDEILELVPELKPFYYEWLEYLEDDEGNLPDDFGLPSKLSRLNHALTDYTKQDNFKVLNLKLILNNIENFVKNSDLKTQKMVEVMFLESMIWWAEDKEDEYAERYGDYFLSCIGPKCRELVKRNNAFWKKLNKEKQERIDKHYAELQKDYDKRMALKNK